MRILVIIFLLFQFPAFGQYSQAERDSIYKLSKTDHQLMKEQLGIQVPNRPGPSGNPNDPNAANSNELNVRDYNLPDLMTRSNGSKLETSDEWWEFRRPEILKAFESEVYGKIPGKTPNVDWEVVNVNDTTIGVYPVLQKSLSGIVDNSGYPAIEVAIEMQLTLPKNVNGPVPVVTHFGFLVWPFGNPPERSNSIISPFEPDWKEQLLARGWGYAILNPLSIQPDHGAGLRQGIIGLINKGQPRSPEDWGALRAWAWGASKTIDYFETDPNIDVSKLAIEGLSRYGKAALVAMAFDSRFSLGFIGSSGAGGAKILRRNFGEQVENLAGVGEYHWFCGNFIKYASISSVDDLPVDGHQLIALCAPRPVFISAGSPNWEGNWIDAKGMFLATMHASPIYELLGTNGLSATEFPYQGMPLISGELAFRQHAGAHSTGPNWSTWISWASRYWVK